MPEAHARLINEMSSRCAEASSHAEVYAFAAEALSRHSDELPFVALYQVIHARSQVRFAASAGIVPRLPLRLSIDPATEGDDPFGFRHLCAQDGASGSGEPIEIRIPKDPADEVSAAMTCEALVAVIRADARLFGFIVTRRSGRASIGRSAFARLLTRIADTIGTALRALSLQKLFFDRRIDDRAEVSRSGGAPLQTLFDATPLGIFLVDARLRLLAVNLAAQPLFGRVADLIGQELSEVARRILHPELASHVLCAISHTLETGEPFFESARSDRRSGTAGTGIYEWQLRQIALPGGEHGVAGYVREVSHRVHTEEALRRAAERDAYRVELSDALRTLNDPLAIQAEAARVAGRHFAANRAKFAEFEDDEDHCVVHHDFHDDAPSVVGRYALASEAPVLHALLRNGRTAVFDDVLTHTDLSQSERQIWLARDARSMVVVPLIKADRLSALFAVTTRRARSWHAAEVALIEETAERTMASVERARSEEALRESEERFRTLFTSIDEGFCLIEILLDQDGQPHDYRFLQLNRSFERLTGLANAAGRTALELVPNLEPFWIQTYGEVALTGKAVNFENESVPMGRSFHVHAARVGGPESLRVALVFTDITQRKLAEQTLRESDRRKDEFLATLAHELRNPLAPIRNALHLLERQEASNPELTARLHAMLERQVSHMTRLVDDLLEIARITRGKIEIEREVVNLTALIEHAVETSEPMIRAGSHTLQVDLPSRPLYLFADPVRMTQVFANLLNNAAKYTEPHGKIAIGARCDGPDVIVEISDSGAGIPAEMLSKIFEPFVQIGGHPQGGIGIGLTLTRKLVELHGGSVRARNKAASQGSVFEVRLPLHHPEDEQPLPTSPHAPRGLPAAGRRVLIVDDNRDAADSLGLLLESLGATVRIAYDGLQALDVNERFGAEIVLLDLGMPGLDGYEVARRLRLQPSGPGTTLVALSGWGQAADRRRTHDAGFDHHMTKPIDLDLLRALLGNHATNP